MDRPPPGVKTGKPESYLRFYLWEIGVLKLPQNSGIYIHWITKIVAGAGGATDYPRAREI